MATLCLVSLVEILTSQKKLQTCSAVQNDTNLNFPTRLALLCPAMPHHSPALLRPHRFYSHVTAIVPLHRCIDSKNLFRCSKLIWRDVESRAEEEEEWL